MEEVYTTHEGTQMCPVCGAEVVDLEHAIKYLDPKNMEAFFFDLEDCYKQFIENPEQFIVIEEDVEMD